MLTTSRLLVFNSLDFLLVVNESINIRDDCVALYVEQEECRSNITAKFSRVLDRKSSKYGLIGENAPVIEPGLI